MQSRNICDFSKEGWRSLEHCDSLEKYACVMSTTKESQLRVVDGVQVSILSNKRIEGYWVCFIGLRSLVSVPYFVQTTRVTSSLVEV